MGKLSILGAQRVKALIEMLNEKEKQAVNDKRAELPRQEDIKKQVDEEFNIKEKTNTLDELIFEATNLASEISEVTGESIRVRLERSNNYRNSNNTEWYKRYIELQEENKKELESIKKDYAHKRNSLWLCETLEEAKEIVGIGQ